MKRIHALSIALHTTFFVILGEMAIIFALTGSRRDMVICTVAATASAASLIIKIAEVR